MPLKKLIVFFLFWNLTGFAKTDDQTELPSYQKILDAQFHCNKKEYESLHFRQDNAYSELATKVWTIVDEVHLSEEFRQMHPKFGKTRDFVLDYTIYGIVRCGEITKAFKGKRGTVFKTLPVLRPAWKLQGKIELGSDNIHNDEEYNPRPEIDLTVSDYLGDEPEKAGREGFSCFVRLKDFIQSPKSLDIDKLCHGESKSKRLAAEKEIQRIWNLLRN